MKWEESGIWGGLLSASLVLGRTEKRSQIGAVRTVIFPSLGWCMQRGREGNRGEGIGVELSLPSGVSAVSLPSRGLRGQPASRTSVRRNTWTNKGDRKRPRKESWKPPLVFGDSKLMAVMGGGDILQNAIPPSPSVLLLSLQALT